MTYTVASFIILAGFLGGSVFANEGDATDDYEISHHTPAPSKSTMSLITNSTENQTDVTQTYSPTTREYVTPLDEHRNNEITVRRMPSEQTPATPRPVTPKPVTPRPVTPKPATPKPATPKPATPRPATKADDLLDNLLVMTTPKPPSQGNDSVGIIILVVIVVIALLAGLICYIARSRSRRYSMDLTSRPDEAQIPLSAVEQEGVAQTVTSNGLEFEGTENSTQEAQEPEEKTEEQVEQKAESEKVTVDVIDECPAPTGDSPDEPKQEVPDQTPAVPLEPSAQEKTDDEGGEGAASNKTSVESLKESAEVNENNSNNCLLPQGGAREGEAFYDVLLDDTA